jgi:hypothetical protein
MCLQNLGGFMKTAFRYDLKIAEQAYDYYCDIAHWLETQPRHPEAFLTFRSNYYATEQICRRMDKVVLNLRGHKNWLLGTDWAYEDSKINPIYFGLQKTSLHLQKVFRSALEAYEKSLVSQQAEASNKEEAIACAA